MSDINTLKIGVLGGGQLGKMLYQAGSRLSMNISCLESSADVPAAVVCPKMVNGSITEYEDVISFGADKDIVTIEIENVNIDALYYLEEKGVQVYPQPSILEIIKDKGRQKEYYLKHGFPTSPFGLYRDADDIERAIVDGNLRYPFVQKARIEGYDGRGVVIVRSESDLDLLLDTASVVESMVQIDREISVIAARNTQGELKTYPVVEMEFHPTANLVENLFWPSALDNETQDIAVNIAGALAEKMGIVGLLAVEMFVDTQGNVLINEVAPRPHNSGHHTIESCVTSQYEQHLRAITGLPLGDTSILMPAAMVNLLGEPHHSGPARYHGLAEVMKLAGVYPHFYGKKETRPFRKMGHVTITGSTLSEVRDKSKMVRNTLKVIS
ncbi:MAG: 5-(carboxyamino)imidazole ribonucleotide synthase [Saprospiraceae bacterium]|nr:5-(carboxyamino)imidazole ribonucleotide synthase [Saprospiraceae bacterium]